MNEAQGTGTPPPTPLKPPAPSVSQPDPAVNPQVITQAAAISSDVPAGSAAPAGPVIQAVAPKPAGQAAKTAARVAAAAASPPAERLTRFRSSTAAQQDMIIAAPSVQQFVQIEAALQTKIGQLEALRRAPAAEGDIQSHQRTIDKLTRDLNITAGDLLKTTQSFQEALAKNQEAALRALKLWIAQECFDSSPILNWNIAFGRLNDLIIGQDLTPAVALLDSLSELEGAHCIRFMEKWAEVLARNPHSACRFICELIRRDVSEEKNEAQLFRSTSMRTRLYAAYQNLQLNPLMARCMQELTKNLKNRDELVKPHPEAGKPNVPMHIVDLKHICQHTHEFLKYLRKELDKQDAVPPDMRDIYRQLALLLRQKGWAEKADTHVNSFLFLRSINPLLANPAGVPQTEKEKQLSANIRVIGKAIQTIINNAGENKNRWDDDLTKVQKGDKESFSASQQPLLAQIGQLLQR